MSLSSQVTSLATRVATEIKALRAEMQPKITVSNTPPANPTVGQLWVDTT